MALRWKIPPSRSGTEGPAGLYWSEPVGYGLLHPLPSDDELQQLYRLDDAGESGTILRIRTADNAGSWDVHVNRLIYRVTSLRAQGQISSPALVARLLGSRRCRILSLGLDPGNMWTAVARAGHEVISVERACIPRTVDQSVGIATLIGTAERLPLSLQRESFDAVAMIHSLSRLRDPVLAITNAASMLKPGGCLWIDVPAAIFTSSAGKASPRPLVPQASTSSPSNTSGTHGSFSGRGSSVVRGTHCTRVPTRPPGMEHRPCLGCCRICRCCSGRSLHQPKSAMTACASSPGSSTPHVP
jgi:SAM-dependent methyltransferase